MRCLVLLLALAVASGHAALAQGTRTPSLNDLPRSGASLFDVILSVDTGGAREHHIPFPFSRLREEIAKKLGLQLPELKEVLVPMGRALQRDAAAPNFYRSPRHLLVVDTETRQDQEQVPVSAKDRLFIGYQELANSLEVISYNEAAGRFEFQIVEDYAPGKMPYVRYARRSLCVSCHQNEGPLFAEAPWSETDANPDVRTRLSAVRDAFHGLPTRSSTQAAEHALAIANAVERANKLPLLQSVWRLGCGEDAMTKQPMNCHASLFLLALLGRLSTSTAMDTTSSAYQQIVRPTFQRVWAKLWPAGLPVPTHLIPDRDPIELGASVTPAMDPLSSREPQEIWRADRAIDTVKAITAMAETFKEPDIRILDTYLATKGRAEATQRQKIVYPCSFSRRPYFDGEVERILFYCTLSDHHRSIFNGHFYFSPQRSVRGRVDALQLPSGETQTQLILKGDALAMAAGAGNVSLQSSDEITGRSVRRADGWALESIRLVWSKAVTEKFDPSAEIPSYPRNGKAILSFVDDVRPIRVAVNDILLKSGTAYTFSGERPFSRQLLMAALFNRLGLPHRGIDHLEPRPQKPAPPSGGMPVGERSPDAGSMIFLFQKHCGPCHRSGSRFPPNFLDGDPQERAHKISHCSERIVYRLAMWLRETNSRSKSPMPPQTFLESIGVNPKTWRDSAELSALLEHAVRHIGSADDDPSPASVLRRPYDDLRRCVP